MTLIIITIIIIFLICIRHVIAKKQLQMIISIKIANRKKCAYD